MKRLTNSIHLVCTHHLSGNKLILIRGGLLDLDLPTGSPARKNADISLFDIPFEVPYRNATRDLEGITSHTLFSTFLVRLSQCMDVGITFLLAIGYVPSFLPKSSKPRPKLLEDEASWNKLVKDVHEYRENCKKKNKGKGQVPAFTISLTDTSNGDGKENKKVSIYYLYIYIYILICFCLSVWCIEEEVR